MTRDLQGQLVASATDVSPLRAASPALLIVALMLPASAAAARRMSRRR